MRCWLLGAFNCVFATICPVMLLLGTICLGAASCTHNAHLAERPLDNHEKEWVKDLGSDYLHWQPRPAVPLRTDTPAPARNVPLPIPTDRKPQTRPLPKDNTAVKSLPALTDNQGIGTASSSPGGIPELEETSVSDAAESFIPTYELISIDGSPLPESDKAPGSKKDTITYKVQKGDTLSGLAHRFYGQPAAWHRIFEANRDTIGNPRHLKAGTELKIPPNNP